MDSDLELKSYFQPLEVHPNVIFVEIPSHENSGGCLCYQNGRIVFRKPNDFYLIDCELIEEPQGFVLENLIKSAACISKAQGLTNPKFKFGCLYNTARFKDYVFDPLKLMIAKSGDRYNAVILDVFSVRFSDQRI